MKKINVIQNKEGEQVSVDIMAESIKAISDGVKKLRSTRLNDKALYLLIQHAAPTINHSKIGMTEIRAVIEGIESLERTYLKKI
jgi:hypothetical protein